MFLEQFYQKAQGQRIISAAQASSFAKDIADDFNPIHDETAKRFCVPGDLLFALVLDHSGLSASMKFIFGGMVSANTGLVFPDTSASSFAIEDKNHKHYLSVQRDGDSIRDAAVIEAFVRSYVSFSGQNFPHILVPLMERHNVMINPERPLVIYESMEFSLQTLDFDAPRLALTEPHLNVAGKRGEVSLAFDLWSGDQRIGTGVKRLVLSGLRPFDAAQMDAVCALYAERKNRWRA